MIVAVTWQGEEIKRDPVTLPKVVLPAIEDDKSEVAARFAEQRTIRAGVEAWQAINKAGSFDSWKAIGKALQVGRDFALRVTGANAPIGRRYSMALSAWLNQHHFGNMPNGTRSWALALNENLSAIEAWRQTLTEGERQRLVNPQSVVKRWQATAQHKTKPVDAAKAAAAWRRFVACVETLPADQAAPFWREAQAQAAALLGTMGRCQKVGRSGKKDGPQIRAAQERYPGS